MEHFWRIILTIELSTKHPHPHIVMPVGWSVYPKEKEALLLPYFPLIVTKEPHTDEEGYIRMTVT